MDPRIQSIKDYNAEIAANCAKLEVMATQTFKSTAAQRVEAQHPSARS